MGTNQQLGKGATQKGGELKRNVPKGTRVGNGCRESGGTRNQPTGQGECQKWWETITAKPRVRDG